MDILIGPIVYRLGHMVFIHERGVRFPLGPPNSTMKFLRVGSLNREKPAIIEEDGIIISSFGPDTQFVNFEKIIGSFGIGKFCSLA